MPGVSRGRPTAPAVPRHLTVAAVHGKPVYARGRPAERREGRAARYATRPRNALPVEQIGHAAVAEVAMKTEDSPGRRTYTPLGTAQAGPPDGAASTTARPPS